jgi:uncharacterized protein (UPF0332 family)/predicted nucleotidyltransferase
MTTLATASLTSAERRVLRRAVAALRAELGDELLAVWLYGSRVNGAEVHAESDVDLVVVTSGGSARDASRIMRIFFDAADAEGAGAALFSPHVESPASLAELRAMDSFYLRNVERERLVLSGDPGGEIPGVDALAEHARRRYAELGLPVKPQTQAFLRQSRDRIRTLGRVETLSPSLAVSAAYYAMLYAARAGLSEEGVEARRHTGTWQRFRERFVVTGRFDATLVQRAQELQALREAIDYRAQTPDREQAAGAVGDARRFVRAVDELLGLVPPAPH